MDTPRNTVTRRAATGLLDAVAEGSTGEEVFSKFASALTYRQGFFAKRHKRSPRERVLSSFHSIIFGDLDKLWDTLYQSLGKELIMDRMLRQYMNEKIFNDMYIFYFAKKDRPAACTATTTCLTAYEHDIIRYIAGYVPIKLFK